MIATLFQYRWSLLLTFLALGVFHPAWGSASADSYNLGELTQMLVGPIGGYGDEAGLSVSRVLSNRIAHHPFHLISAMIFAGAIIHTFFAHSFTKKAHEVAAAHKARQEKKAKMDGQFVHAEDLERDVSFQAEVLHFLGEVEVIFGLWVVPLMALITYQFNWATVLDYIETRNYTEPLFVIVVMSVAGTRPIIRIAEVGMSKVANLFGGGTGAWWCSILIIGPLLGSLITEPGAMTISALLLARYFYRLEPSRVLKYATLGLLFVNISVGGVLTHFAAPPVLMVAGPWGWDTSFMLQHFGWKAVVGVILNTAIYYLIFRPELTALSKKAKKHEDETQDSRRETPTWIVVVHLVVLIWVVMHSHYPAIVLGTFLLFLGFYQATAPHQTEFSVRPPMLVGFFLAGLVIHGGLQGWWIEPIVQSLSANLLLGAAVVLTAFNDNAAVTYLTTQIPNLSDTMKYAVVAGAVTGGGLTVIANAPNPAGQSLLNRYFKDNISPINLMLGALFPTLVMAAIFLVFK